MEAKKKIIICDDDHGIVSMLEMVLEYSGEYTVQSEINSLNIFEILLNDKPDLLLIDLWMPVLSGDQVIRHIRATKEIQDLPILAISASPDGTEIALAAGADIFLAKPFDMDLLFAKINEAIAKND